MNRALDFSTGAGLTAGSSLVTEAKASDEVISIQVISGTSPNVVYEISNDGATWVTGQLRPACNFGATQQASIAAAGVFVGMVQTRFMRVRNAGANPVFGIANLGIGWIN